MYVMFSSDSTRKEIKAHRFNETYVEKSQQTYNILIFTGSGGSGKLTIIC